jgi:hypothetical protein
MHPQKTKTPRQHPKGDKKKTAKKRGFCIFINAVFEGIVPSVRGDNDLPFIFATRVEAEREIADNMITRHQEFIDGERDFENAMTVEEYVDEVIVLPDGSVTDMNGKHFGSRRT